GGTAIASGGSLVATGARFSYRDALITTAPVDLDVSRMHQARQVSHEPILGEDDRNAVVVTPNILDGTEAPCPFSKRDREFTKNEEFSRAVALGLFDYMRKSWSGGFVVSLSGGADSTACAVLIKVMTHLAILELGEEAFKKKLHYIDFSDRPVMDRLLTCVYQATRNSGEVTRNAAQTIADGIGARYQEWDIDAQVEGYKAIVQKGIGRDLTWETDDLTLQNIQARVRSPGIWMIANIENALLLATSNRSEAAVGYATMDGDTSGGLSPICGIDKAFLRSWLRWLETDGDAEVAPIPSLKVVNEQEPTAELRPADQNQTDEGDLMPYPILDSIERLAIRDKKLPQECLDFLVEKYPDYQRDILIGWVKRFFQL
ncbi:MAG: NAD(+) synthase, partial [Verrucomicrobiota bacterium]